MNQYVIQISIRPYQLKIVLHVRCIILTFFFPVCKEKEITLHYKCMI